MERVSSLIDPLRSPDSVRPAARLPSPGLRPPSVPLEQELPWQTSDSPGAEWSHKKGQGGMLRVTSHYSLD
ncbi:unnamed protein product [Arctogadus glacialis]